jgi:hypothetical protein
LKIDTQAPTLPTITQPALDATVDYATQSYDWTTVSKSPDASAVTYQLQISKDQTFATVEINVPSLSTNTYNNAVPLTSSSTYYARVKATDAATNTSGFTTAHRFFTTQAFLCGDADGSENVDISDAVYLIAYIFQGGPAPNPLESGDADCSTNVDISDAVFLIAYIFQGGPAPCEGC